MTIEEIKKWVEEVAKTKIPWDEDEFMPDDYAGGNIDDAWEGGAECGEVTFARQVLYKLKEID